MIRYLVADDSSETNSYDKFVRPTAIRNEMRFYVWSEGEILPIGVCPFYRQDKGERGENDGRNTYSEQSTQPKAPS